tara:strand:+ start:312 stop:848 length:537 start_codon:yes stop_codon:yes gene_type:complete
MGVPSRLTEMQMKFCEILVFGGKDGPVTGTEAAIQAGYSADRARFTASELQNIKKSPKVVAYLTELRREKLNKFEVNYENHIARLGNLGIKSEKKGNMQAAIRAEELRGKASDLYINRTEMRTGKLDDLSTAELKEKIKVIEAEEIELKKAKKQLNAPVKSLSSSSHTDEESSSDPQK